MPRIQSPQRRHCCREAHAVYITRPPGCNLPKIWSHIARLRKEFEVFPNVRFNVVGHHLKDKAPWIQVDVSGFFQKNEVMAALSVYRKEGTKFVLSGKSGGRTKFSVRDPRALPFAEKVKRGHFYKEHKRVLQNPALVNSCRAEKAEKYLLHSDEFVRAVYLDDIKPKREPSTFALQAKREREQRRAIAAAMIEEYKTTGRITSASGGPTQAYWNHRSRRISHP